MFVILGFSFFQVAGGRSALGREVGSASVPTNFCRGDELRSAGAEARPTQSSTFILLTVPGIFRLEALLHHRRHHSFNNAAKLSRFLDNR